ncbi:PEP/pyruvate-binding domain-containing protein [Streptomyces sp. 4N509B]|uniref:PEP/pyruvate-binding domain-containing protein n=1 Tax=Streptomyces sp. 4N509B TaxID=3457413 RepID=UPI003FCFC2A4
MVDIGIVSGHESRGVGASPGTVLDLGDPRARSAEAVGGKAAALARAAGAGLPVLPGFVIPPPVTDDDPSLRRAWRRLSGAGRVALVVRSSSAAEDTAVSSMAGRFVSVLDVRGWEGFLDAVRAVRASARQAATSPVAATSPANGGAPADGGALAEGATDGEAPMAVLVQPMVRCRVGGVLFGADPVTGRTDRLLVSVVPGGPDSLVSGARPGVTVPLSPHGRLTADAPPDSAREARRLLTPAETRRLAALARRAAHLHGGPQDIEFGFEEHTGTLRLFQSRPITAMAARPARHARLLGPGPVAETLPDVLQPLEEDLWVVPMAHGLATALDVGGAAPRSRLRRDPVVFTVEGRAVADLRLLGVAPRRRRSLALLAALNPLPALRRLAAAWRVGRLRGTLPELAAALTAEVDRELTHAPPLAGSSAHGLLAALRWSRSALRSLHAQEALAGALLADAATADARTGEGTAAGRALAALHHGRAEGMDDAALVAAHPEVLALVPPSLTRPLRLPAQGAATPAATARLSPREALRLRIRWVQEFQVRLVGELARRVDGLGERVALLRWPELTAAAEGRPLPSDLAERRPRAAGAPLPDAFRLADGGLVVADRLPGPREGAGDGALGVSGGRVTGVVWDGTGPPPAYPVLVVRVLDPALAPLLPRLAGLVAQTGSPLSHLAVLARELRLPTVTGVTGAVDRFPPGTRVTVDGSTGEVLALPGTAGADGDLAPTESANGTALVAGEAGR